MVSSAVKDNQASDSSDKMRDRIIQASIKYMSLHGSERLSMAEVARIAKVARATVYNYFESKEALILAAEYSLEDALFESLANEIKQHREIQEQLISIVITLRKVWIDREHTPWFGFLSPVDEAKLKVSKATSHLAALSKFLQPYLEVASQQGQLRRGMNIAMAAEFCARLVFSFALENQETAEIGEAHVRDLFNDFLLIGIGR